MDRQDEVGVENHGRSGGISKVTSKLYVSLFKSLIAVRVNEKMAELVDAN
ncbi:hypothetical protein [Chryseobacterium arthrosphaerae]